MKMMFKVLEGCQHVQTLKFQNNGLTISTFQKLVGYLAQDNCPIMNLFIDWNPIYTDDFKAGDMNAGCDSNQLYKVADEEEQNPWSKLIESCKKLQVLFVRANCLTDDDLKAITKSMTHNNSIKVIDISSNRDFTPEVISSSLAEILTANRVIEYFGLSKLNLVTENVLPLFELFGRFPFPEDQVESHLAELKKKTAIEEKNKKLRQQKKPEEPVPQLDNIE